MCCRIKSGNKRVSAKAAASGANPSIQLHCEFRAALRIAPHECRQRDRTKNNTVISDLWRDRARDEVWHVSENKI
eukprot:6480712-Pyramimonas_sp.AAC.1